MQEMASCARIIQCNSALVPIHNLIHRRTDDNGGIEALKILVDAIEEVMLIDAQGAHLLNVVPPKLILEHEVPV